MMLPAVWIRLKTMRLIWHRLSLKLLNRLMLCSWRLKLRLQTQQVVYRRLWLQCEREELSACSELTNYALAGPAGSR